MLKQLLTALFGAVLVLGMSGCGRGDKVEVEVKRSEPAQVVEQGSSDEPVEQPVTEPMPEVPSEEAPQS